MMPCVFWHNARSRHTSIHVSMRFIYVAAAVGMAIVVLFIAPVVLMAASSAHADAGMSGYLRCIQSAGVPPRRRAEDWRPTIQIINGDLGSKV